jgi:outer membrane lipoprotein-sorting protein
LFDTIFKNPQKMKKYSLSLLAVAVLSATTTSSTFAQSGDEIIAKHIEAIGGEKNWNKITSLKQTGAMSVQGMEIATSRTTVDKKGMRMDLSVMGMDCYVILTSKEGWMYMPIQPGMDKVTPIPEDQIKQSQGRLNIKHSLLADKSQITAAKYLGTDTMDNVPCFKVAVSDKDGNDQTAYFDVSNYYLVRSEVKVKTKDEEQELAMTFSNFQKLPEGIVIPMTENNPQMGGDIVYKTVEVNKPVSDDVFKPTEPKK